jgi:peptidoglycan/xylan/chitin deacetylase (PgdA/CDA1 family)
MRPSLDEVVKRAAAVLPEEAVDELFRRGVAGLNVALCLHRVLHGPRRPGETLAELSIPAGELDVFVERALSARPGGSEPWLTLSFDDGYEDAARYVQSRVRRFAQVEWLFFVCPEKAEKQAGFRWDLPEVGLKPLEQAMEEPVDLVRENEREDLRELARQERFRLSTVEECRRLGQLPGVQLGNHTNVHHNPLRLSAEQARAEYGRAHADFERLWGRYGHFAFPFGSPEREFRAEHVEMVRRLGRLVLWSTEARPYASAERRPGAVLPRFPVNGNWSAHELLLWVAVRSLRYRVRGSRYAYPEPLSAPAAA